MKNRKVKHLKFGLIAIGIVLLLSFVSVYGDSNTMTNGKMSGGMMDMRGMNGDMMGECHEAMESGDMSKMQSMMQKHMG